MTGLFSYPKRKLRKLISQGEYEKAIEFGNELEVKFSKDPDFLLKLLNEQGKILPRRITGTSAKYQSRVNKAIKRARHLAILPYVGDMLK